MKISNNKADGVQKFHASYSQPLLRPNSEFYRKMYRLAEFSLSRFDVRQTFSFKIKMSFP